MVGGGGTRWLRWHFCVDRILHCWDAFYLFHNELLMSTLNSKKTHRNISEVIDKMSNPVLKAYLCFLRYVFNFYNIFNAHFQTSKNAVHELYGRSMWFIRTILNNFLRPALLQFFWGYAHSLKVGQRHYPVNSKTITRTQICEHCSVELELSHIQTRLLKEPFQLYPILYIEREDI